MKTQHVVKLVGLVADGKPAKTHQAAAVGDFVGNNGYFTITPYEDKSAVILQTPKGKYDLAFNKSAGIYQGIVNNTKIHVSLNKIIGKLIYWA